MAENCKIEFGAEGECNETGPAGLDLFKVIDASYVTGYQLDSLNRVYGITLSGTKKFQNVKLKDKVSSFVSDPVTNKDAGSQFRNVAAVVRIADTPLNRTFITDLANADIKVIVRNKKGQYRCLFITSSTGGRMTEVPESAMVSGDAVSQDSMLFNLLNEEPVDAGVLFIQYPVQVWDNVFVFAIDDFAYDAVNDCYFQALTAGAGNALPTCGASNANWKAVTKKYALQTTNEINLAPLFA